MTSIAPIADITGRLFISFSVSLILLPYLLLSSARIAASIHYYSSPLILYNHLATRELGVNSHTPAIICLGKEWYRFGSSFFIPNKEQHVAFVKSGFDGLLPQVLAEAANHS